MAGNIQIGELIEISDRLASVMAHETELLRELNTGEIAPLQEEKATLAAAYSGALESVRSNPAMMQAADPGQRAALKESMAELKAKLGDNLSAVQAAKTVNERLIRALSEAVAEQNPPGAAYTSNGGSTPSVATKQAVSVTFDHRV